jgi:hypothetical protein
LKISMSKTTATTITLFLMLTIAVAIIPVLPSANAAVTYYHTFVYVGATPNIIGVNQQELLVMWTDNIPPDIGEIAAAEGQRAGWNNVGINVTKPDGTVEEFIIDKTDPVGGGFLLYTPDTVGTYSVQSWFPDTWKNTTTNQAFYGAAVSTPVTFTVQQEQIPPWPEAPLPTGYWTRPINDASRNWYVLGSNWLGGSAQAYAPGYSAYSTGIFGSVYEYSHGPGPESAHILWTKPYYAGGIMDEMFGNYGYETAHYQGIDLGNPIIIQGKIIVQYRATAHAPSGWLVIDLYTGETLSLQNDSTIPAFGQIYNYESPNQHGGFPYLWRTSGITLPAGYTSASGTSTWEMLDGYTLRSICMVANVSTGGAGGGFFFGGGGGTQVYGKDGSITYYFTTNYGTNANPNYYLQCWNISAVKDMLATTTGTTAWQWRPQGGGFGGGPPLGYYVHNGATGFSINVSIPSIYGPRNALLNETGTIRAVREDDLIIIGTAGRNDERGVVPGYMLALSLKPGEIGTKLWETTCTPPLGSVANNVTISLGTVDPDSGVFCYESTKTLERWGYDLKTGKQLWEGEPEVQYNYFGMSESVYEGELISYGYGGQLRAYNITTGDILWTYNATTVGEEVGYGGNYPIGIAFIADGKLYTVASEHSPTQPLWRGQNLRCINATTGEEIWKILFWGARMSPTESDAYIADGIVVGLNYFDMELYGFGKGNSATTVSAPQTTPTLGSSVTITGTVTDQSPSGRRNTNDILDFSLKGTPAISDEDMSAWMEYMFMDQAMPTNAKGVEVSLDTVDPNGNFVHIGTVTSDMTGAYGYKWTPDVPGTYQIIATFAGSKSYGPSYAQTYMTVAEAPPATPPPTEYPQPIDYTWTIIIATVVLLIAMILIGIWIRRK